MKTALKIGLPLALALGSGSAFAIGYGTTATIDGNTYTISAAGSPVQRLGDSISFSLPNAVALTAPKTVTLTYTVTADPGYTLRSNSQVATGQNTGASTSTFETRYTATSGAFETSSQASTAGGAYPMYTYNFASPVLAYSVTTTLTLRPSGGASKASAFTSNYTQAVPEPMTLAVLGLGLVGIARRKRS